MKKKTKPKTKKTRPMKPMKRMAKKMKMARKVAKTVGIIQDLLHLLRRPKKKTNGGQPFGSQCWTIYQKGAFRRSIHITTSERKFGSRFGRGRSKISFS